MSLSFLEGLGAFAQGVQERSSEIDADLAARVKELNDKSEDENLKSRFTDEYARWTKDRDLIESVESAGGPGTEQGQFLLGGYSTIQDYREAYARDNNLYHTMVNIGDAPVLTPTQYGLTNLDSSGRVRTTASKLFNKAFRPEIFEKNQEFEDSREDVAGSTTTYRRGKGNVNTDEVIAANKAKLQDIFASNKETKGPEKLTVNKLVDGVMMTYELIKSDNENLGTVMEGFDGYRQIGDGKAEPMSNLQEKFAELGDAPIGANFDTVEEYEVAKDNWQKGYNKILFGVTSLETAEGPKVGTITSGVYDSEGNQVNVQYTGEDTDNFMNMQGYRQFGGEAPDSQLNKTKEYYDKETNSVQLLIYKGGESNYKGLEGWQPFGDSKPVEESYNLQTTYNEKGQEVKILRTGNSTDSFEGNAGWLQIGQPKETPASKMSASDLKWQPMQIIVDAIASGGVVSEEQLNAAEFVRAQSDSAMEAEFASVLQNWEDITIMVRDFSMLPMVKVDVDGNDTDDVVYMTQKNIKEQAARKQMTAKTYRRVLLKIMQTPK